MKDEGVKALRVGDENTELRKQTLEQEGMKYPGKAPVAMEREPGGCFPIFRQ